MTTVGTVTSLHRFPVKSMQGDRPDSVEVDESGIVGDRTWALRDTGTGKLVSAKRPRLWRAMLDCRASGAGADVQVTLPDGATFAIEDPALADALGSLFERPVTVEASTGPQQGSYESDWPEIDGITLAGEMDLPTNLTGEGSSFVDLGVIHLLTTTSLDTLQETAPDIDVDVRRFRPSVVVDTPGEVGFPENEWTGTTLAVGEVEITIGDPTPRCVMTTVAQSDLPRRPRVLQAIAAVNRRSNDLGTFACLGSYATVARPGTIRAGDEVRIV